MDIELRVAKGERVADKRDEVVAAVDVLLDRMMLAERQGLALAKADGANEDSEETQPQVGRDMQIKPHSVAPLNTLRLRMLRGYYDQMQLMRDQLVAAIEDVTQGKDIAVDKPPKASAKAQGPA